MQRKLILSVLFAAVALPVICARLQEVQAAPAAASAVESTSLHDRYREIFNPGHTDEEAAALRAKLPFDSISLQRTPCFGTCPVYSVTFHRNGEAEFEAKEHLPKLGKFSGKLDVATYGRLCYLIEQSRFQDLKDRYQASWTDDTTCIVTVSGGEKRKEVSDYGSVGPIELWAIQQIIDSVRESISWTPVP